MDFNIALGLLTGYSTRDARRSRSNAKNRNRGACKTSFRKLQVTRVPEVDSGVTRQSFREDGKV